MPVSTRATAAAANMTSPEESNAPVRDQATGVEASAVLPASTAPGAGLASPGSGMASANSVPVPVAPSPAVAAEHAPAGGEDDEEDDDDGYLSDDSDEGIEAKAKGVLASKTRATLTLLTPFELEKEMPAVKPSVKALLVYLRKKLSDNALDGLAFQELLPTYLSHIHLCCLQVTLATAADAEVVRQHRVEHVSAGVVRKILRDPALVLISTGAKVEEWLCVQECCERAHGNTFAQAAAHIGSFSHGAALGSAGVATRASKAKLSLQAAKKLYGIHTVVAATPTARAGGVAIVLRNNEVSCSDVVRDASGRLVRVTMAWRGVTVTVVAAYFPASPTARSPFFRDVLKPFLEAIPAGSHLLLAGDLNIIEDPALDKTSGLGSRGENDRLMSICSSFDVRDAFRALHPCLREYTFYAAAVQESTRIDRILLSNALIHQIHDVRHVGLTKKFTDHWSAVHLQLSAGGDGESGPGLWRLPASQVPRPGVQRRVEQIVRKNAERGGDLEALMASLTVGLKAYTVEERKRVAATTAHLEREVGELRQQVMCKPRCPRAKARLARCEAKLKAYVEGRRRKLQEQAGIKMEMNGEAPTGYLSSRVKARKAKTRLADVLYQGSRYEGAKEALAAASAFYTKLFAAGADTQLEWSVDKRLSLEDVAGSVRPGKRRRSSVRWRRWHRMMQFLKEFEWTGALPKEFSTAVTVLLHKKGAKDDLQNYRPITLLSTVYKLIAKVLANRIRNKLESVVSTGQFGFLPGRSIAGAVAVAEDVIDAANAGQEDWLMLLVDFRKAFDSVARGYLFDVLRKMGFPETYVKWVEGLHQGAATRICNDGWLGEEVPVLTGVRQGCPLAPYLFLCAVEPFCQEARRRWLGISVKDAGRMTYLGYADDTTLLLNGRSQLGDAELLLKEFEKMSGLAVNWDKSVVLPLGRQRGILPPADGAFKWASRDDPERLLGVWITPGGDAKPSWKKALSRMEAELKKWEAKFLTTMARVTVVNAYIMPIALFQAQIYPPPDTIWEELRRLCHAFVSGGRASSEPGFILWNGDLMQLGREEGGLGVINLKDRLDAEALHSLAQLLT
ncbi:unnamed protein product [Closterium sp. Yama58-4]|nr:unnamed protein product [Closterium sp. Yama58-4]